MFNCLDDVDVGDEFPDPSNMDCGETLPSVDTYSDDDDLSDSDEFHFDEEEEVDNTELWIDDDAPLEVDQPTSDQGVMRITQLYLMFLFTWQSLFKVSDVGMNVLLSFIAVFLLLLVTTFRLQPLQDFVRQLPRTVRKARTFLGGNSDDFFKVCEL